MFCTFPQPGSVQGSLIRATDWCLTASKKIDLFIIVIAVGGVGLGEISLTNAIGLLQHELRQTNGPDKLSVGCRRQATQRGLSPRAVEVGERLKGMFAW